jgi:DNA end-binding protein Ku
MVALGRIVLAKRERVIALEPHGKGMLGTTLRYGYEVRKPEELFSDITDVKVPGEMLKLAEHILDTKTGDFDPSEFEDRYETALVELMRKKQAGFKPPKAKERGAAPRNVINLMEALRRSVQAERAAPVQAKKGRKRIEGQRECRSRAKKLRRERQPRNPARAAPRGDRRRRHCAQPILRSPWVDSKHAVIPSIPPRVIDPPQNGLSAATSRATDRRAAPGNGTAFSALAPS